MLLIRTWFIFHQIKNQTTYFFSPHEGNKILIRFNSDNLFKKNHIWLILGISMSVMLNFLKFQGTFNGKLTLVNASLMDLVWYHLNMLFCWYSHILISKNLRVEGGLKGVANLKRGMMAWKVRVSAIIPWRWWRRLRPSPGLCVSVCVCRTPADRHHRCRR